MRERGREKDREGGRKEGGRDEGGTKKGRREMNHSSLSRVSFKYM